MRAVLQRVSEASIEVEGRPCGEIGRGLVVFLGVQAGDSPEEGKSLAEKILTLRVFADDRGKMDLSLLDVAGDLLLVSQFTLLADCRRGRRPEFVRAAPPDEARPLYTHVADRLRSSGLKLVEGVFGAHMLVRIANDGPVTILLDSRERGFP